MSEGKRRGLLSRILLECVEPDKLNELWLIILINRARKFGRTFKSILRKNAFRNLSFFFLYGYLASAKLGTWCRHLSGRTSRSHARSIAHISIISHQQFILTREIRNVGRRSAFVALNTSDDHRLNIGFDYGIPANLEGRRRNLRQFYLLWFVLARYDVIHYHFNAFLIGNEGAELPYLKRMGKVIVFHFRGCDVRSRSVNTARFPDLNVCQECDYPVGSCDTDFQRTKLRRVREFGDLFFATTPDLVALFDGAEHIPFISPTLINFETIETDQKAPGVFRIVTSSNHPGLDGVRFIREAVTKLQDQGYPVELVEICREKYFKTLSIYKSADLYVGKLRMGYYNNANIETMLMGVANVSYINEEFADIAPDCPIICARPENVYDKIKHCLDNLDELREIAGRGPDFVRNHHGPDVVIRRMLERYDDAFQRKQGAA